MQCCEIHCNYLLLYVSCTSSSSSKTSLWSWFPPLTSMHDSSVLCKLPSLFTKTWLKVSSMRRRLASYLQVATKLYAEQGRMHKMQGVISTDVEAENCLSGMLEKFHGRLFGLVSAAPVTAIWIAKPESCMWHQESTTCLKTIKMRCALGVCIDACWQPCLMT